MPSRTTPYDPPTDLCSCSHSFGLPSPNTLTLVCDESGRTSSVFVSLGLSSSSTVRMLICIHRHTSDCWADTQPTFASCFPKLHMLMSLIAHYSDRRAYIVSEFANLSTCKL